MKAIWQVILVSAIIHLILIIYSLWHDKNFQFKYTDLDYWVFTDAAKAVSAGISPFARATYRYTPLLAYTLVPGRWMKCERSFGKILFSSVDLIVGYLIYRLLRLKGWHSVDAARHSALFWLLNPMALAISTRGNAESLVCACILSVVYLLMIRKRVLAAILFGFSVHFKIFPIIYAPSILFFLGIYHQIGGKKGKVSEAGEKGSLNDELTEKGKGSKLVYSNSINNVNSSSGINLSSSPLIRSASPNKLTESMSGSVAGLSTLLHHRRNNFSSTATSISRSTLEMKSSVTAATTQVIGTTRVTFYPPSKVLLSLFSGRITFKSSHVLFSLISASVFLSLTALFYLLHGKVFLREALLYHLIRKDHRHNFSPYFLPFYLESAPLLLPNWLPVAAFIPQFILMAWIALKYARKDLPFACFLQTFIFVSFNKVCTSQYFLWYLCFLPIITSSLRRMNILKWTIATFLWAFGQAVWLYFNYLFEHLGQNTFVSMWLAALLFLFINTAIASFLSAHHFSSNLFKKIHNHNQLKK